VRGAKVFGCANRCDQRRNVCARFVHVLEGGAAVRKLRTILVALGVIALVVVISSLTPNRAWADGCGPGLHWVDGCPAGDDLFPSTTAVVGIDLNGDDCESVELDLTLSGPTTVHRDAEADGEIHTEIVSMELTGGGVTLRAGKDAPVTNPIPDTVGSIQEQTKVWTLADSFFDVFFEVDVPGEGLLYNHEPVRVEAVIDRVPPWNTIYLPPEDLCVRLFDAEGEETGMNLAHAEHDTGPPPGGGIVELAVDGSDAPASATEGGGAASFPYAAIAGAAGAALAAVIALAAGGWHVRRRLS
jgi:hypothetical protein